MTTKIVHRPARTVRPPQPEQPVVINPPPRLTEGRSGTNLAMAIPMVASVIAMAMMTLLRGNADKTFMILGAVVVVVSLVAVGIASISSRGQAGRQRRHQRALYLRYLDELRSGFQHFEARTREQLHRAYPSTEQLLDVVHDPARLWERRRVDPDFLLIRIGTGRVPSRPIELRGDSDPVNPPDPFMANEARSLVSRFGTLPEVPICLPMDRVGEVSIVAADYQQALDLARVMITQIAATHAPDDVRMGLIVDQARQHSWTWAQWLPHLTDPDQVGATGPVLRVAPTAAELFSLLGQEISDRVELAGKNRFGPAGASPAAGKPRLVIINDCHGRNADPLPITGGASYRDLGITVIRVVADRVHEPDQVAARITAQPPTRWASTDAGSEIFVEHFAAGGWAVGGLADRAGAAFAEGLVRELTALRLSAESIDDGTGTPPASFPALLGIQDPRHLDLEARWRPRSDRDFLRVPFGIRDSDGQPVMLDFKESAQYGMGPHGLCVGATGSGKSELLRTLVLALASSHPPDRLSMMLVDYKGGATFAPFSTLPHVAGMVTNLSDDAGLVERMYTSLDGEVLRRQQALADAGRLTDIVEYNLRRREVGEDAMPPLPNLLVIIDEFGELLTAKPEFSELFLRIGRIGRSIGVHLLLSSQRLEAGKIRGLDSYLSYRLGLRTLSVGESRTVLDTPDAYSLPSLPGVGYLKVDVSVYDRFKAAYISGPLTEDEPDEAVPTERVSIRPLPRYGQLPQQTEATVQNDDDSTARTTGPSLLSVITDQIVDHAADRKVAPIWLPPLPNALTLDRAAGGLEQTDDGYRLQQSLVVRTSMSGAGAAADQETDADDRLVVPIGLLDDPARQWQGCWQLDLSGAGGSTLLIGGPATGKSATLRTIALSIASSRTPTEVGIYGMDLLGNGLRAIAELPHVGGVAGRDERERIRRTVEELGGMLAAREAYFREKGLDTVADLRADPGHFIQLGCTEVVLLIDGYGQLTKEFESLSDQVYDLLARGGRYGIHVVATARRFNDVRIAQQAGFGSKIEFRLTEPAESGIDPRAARAMAKAPAGRAMTQDKLIGQVALARLDGVADDDVDGTVEAAQMIRGAWSGPLPPPIRVLPAVLPAADVLDESPTADRKPGDVVIGRLEQDFAPARLDLFGDDQHLVALGDSDTGKTNLIKLVAGQLRDQLSDAELVFGLYDPRRRLAGTIPEAYLGGTATNPTLAMQLSSAIAKELSSRSADPGKGGPRIVLLIDDYDVLAASASQPLAPLLPYLAAGRDIGLHVIMSRRVMGASRGLFEPFTLGVRESGAVSLLMSGDRGEGQLFPGIRPSVLPPGRGQLIRPGEKPLMVQTAFVGEPDDQGSGGGR